jgi:hypothetical protein
MGSAGTIGQQLCYTMQGRVLERRLLFSATELLPQCIEGSVLKTVAGLG